MMHLLLMAVTAFVFFMLTCYMGGYLASCGWHRRKKEFLQQMMSEATDGERHATARV
jgi:hypothetical protein